MSTLKIKLGSKSIKNNCSTFLYLARLCLCSLLILSCEKNFEDTNQNSKYNVLQVKLNEEIAIGNYTQVIQTCDSMLQSRSLSDKWQAEFLNIKGNVLFFQGDFKGSLTAYTTSLSLREKIKDEAKISDSYTNIGMVYSEINNNDKAAYFIKKALESKVKINDTLGLISTYINMGNLEFRKQQWSSALALYRKAVKFNIPQKNKQTEGSIYNNIGATYKEMNQLDSAYTFFNKSLSIAEQLKDYKGKAIAYNNIGSICMRQHKKQKAVWYFEASAQLNQQIGAKAYEVESHTNLAHAQLELKNYTASRRAFDQALFISKDLVLDHKQREIYNGYINLDTAQGQYKEAISHYNEYITSLTKQLQFNFEKQMEYIQINNDIEQAKIENDLLNERIASQRKKTTLYIAIILFLLALVGVLWLYFSRKNLQNKLIEKQLLAEIEVLKSEALISNTLTIEQSIENVWNKASIEEIWQAKINESDWKILETLKNQPMLNNQEIAEQVNLSLEGVRSSLKKMYRYAGLEKRSPNQKLNLIHALLKTLQSTNNNERNINKD
jgi:tetratricopeptide (TPR) repeat protein